ncbi:MAG: purine-nucleoside phosphorylase [Deltaproteobacteria bacterium]|nr:purine-nucleoside phosphorylase [Deltaproteobacteria bacterium]
MSVTKLETEIAATATAVKSALGVDRLPPTLVVLGSGFKGFENNLSGSTSVELQELPHVASPSVQGHGASLVAGTIGNTPLVVMTGRLHLYEGLSAHDIVYPLRVLATLGVKRVLLTNASGSLCADVPPGTLVAVTDQINMTGTSCLMGPKGKYFGKQFLDMASAWDKSWLEKICALDHDIVRGVYVGVLGPAYETPAEARMLAGLGATVVGMSTVQETMAAHQLGLKVACLSFVTNMSGGLGEPLTHDDVLDLVAKNQERLQSILIKAVGV